MLEKKRSSGVDDTAPRSLLVKVTAEVDDQTKAVVIPQSGWRQLGGDERDELSKRPARLVGMLWADTEACCWSDSEADSRKGCWAVCWWAT